MDDFTKKFNELAVGAHAFVKKYKEAKADFGECDPNVKCFLEDVGCAVRSLQMQIDWLQQQFSQHLQGHLPAAKSVEQMTRAVEALGLDDEYDVQKSTIYAQVSRRGTSFIVG